MTCDRSSQAAPTRVRQGVIVFGVTLAVIAYIDRICIMKTAHFIEKDLGLTRQDWNTVLYVSAAAYALGAFCWLFMDPVTPLKLEPEEVMP